MAELWREDLVFDPQTSGGLLAAVPERDVQEIMKRLDAAGLQAGVIGEVVGSAGVDVGAPVGN